MRTPKKQSVYPSCDWKYCRNNGTLFPIIILPEPNWTHGNSKIEMEMDLNVCTKHADDKRVDWFIDDIGWNQIENTLAIRRLAIPERNTAYVIFRALEDRTVAV